MVENKTKGRGRPRSFDEHTVLERAIGVFWQKGFEGASLDDLSAAMGIGRPSLYCAFGDKDALYKRCLDQYVATRCFASLQMLSEKRGIREAVLNYLESVARNATSDPSHLGCMLGAASVGSDQHSTKSYVADRVREGEIAIAARLTQAVDSGALPSKFDVHLGSRRIMDAVFAINTRAASGTPLSQLLLDATDVTDLLLG